MMEAIRPMDTPDHMDSQHQYSIISGMSLRSSFVGMVHILNSTETANFEALQTSFKSIQG